MNINGFEDFVVAGEIKSEHKCFVFSCKVVQYTLPDFLKFKVTWEY
jgi:hypothetical protein